ncbi:glycosyltransferase family 2 protein [candidate division WWE3 bacterium]|nr:glycosyltransferase family 2 protein [candidate division WWE3 bacterium]
MVDFSIIIPAYNEESGITSSLTQVLNFMRGYNDNFEIIVVDDGSSDRTCEKVEAYARENQVVSVVRNPHKGKAFAIRTGILMSSGKYVLMADADMATPIEELKRLMVWITDHNFDIVIASREGIGAKRFNEPLMRHIMGRVFNTIIRFVSIQDFQDTQCGFKVFKGDVAKNIFGKLLLFGADSPNIKNARVSAFDVEVLIVAKRLGYRTKEVPVSWTYVPTVRVNPFRDSLLNLLDVLKVKLNDILGKYSNYN